MILEELVASFEPLVRVLDFMETLGILINAFVAYHIFSLSKKISNSAKLQHKENIKEKVSGLLSRIRKNNLRRKVYLVNIKRYFQDYPENEDKLVGGYSHIAAEIKAEKFNGVEFFCSLPQRSYFAQDGSVVLEPKGNQEAFLVYPVGLIPYDWIECVDPCGDEFSGHPLVYCKFKGKIYWKSWWRKALLAGYPYKELRYYCVSETYREGLDPAEMKWRSVHVKARITLTVKVKLKMRALVRSACEKIWKK